MNDHGEEKKSHQKRTKNVNKRTKIRGTGGNISYSTKDRRSARFRGLDERDVTRDENRGGREPLGLA